MRIVVPGLTAPTWRGAPDSGATHAVGLDEPALHRADAIQLDLDVPGRAEEHQLADPAGAVALRLVLRPPPSAGWWTARARRDLRGRRSCRRGPAGRARGRPRRRRRETNASRTRDKRTMMRSAICGVAVMQPPSGRPKTGGSSVANPRLIPHSHVRGRCYNPVVLEFRILGPLEVIREGEPVDLSGRRQRAVLTLLLLHANQLMPADVLRDRLWGEHRRRPLRRPCTTRCRSSASCSVTVRSRRVLPATSSTSTMRVST